MDREGAIQKLRQMAPVIMSITATSDLGYEFSAIVPEGVISAEPGMLLSYSGGAWPPSEWEHKTVEEYEKLLRSFVFDEAWEVRLWQEMNDEEIEQLFSDVYNSELNRSSVKS
jgi:hypothetical protein